MTSGNEHPREELHDLLDGRLEAARRAEVDAHLADCAECRIEWTALVDLRDTLRATLSPAPMPEDLLLDLHAALDRQDATTPAVTPAVPAVPAVPAPPAAATPRPARRPARVAAMWVGIAAAAVIAVVYMVWPTAPGLPEEIAAAHDAYVSGGTPPALATADAAELQRYFDANLTFQIHVYDLAMMGDRLVGGRIDRLGGGQSAECIYEDAAGHAILCHMLLAELGELPPGAESRTHDGIPFRIYRRDRLTLVFWPEGAMICVLTSELPAEDVISLAYAKAART